jgi:hypothetical protein
MVPDVKHIYVTGIDRGRATFSWPDVVRFCVAINGGTGPPSFRDKLKIHCIWDAAEQSVRERRWIAVDYGALGAS